MKRCVRFNYIPHKTPKYNNYNNWFLEYKTDIIQMFNITLNNISEKYPDIIRTINIDKQFQRFSRMIFKSSSKFIFKDYYIK